MGDLLEFGTPGIVHQLGNQIFAVRGAAFSLSNDGAAGHARELLSDAAENTSLTLEILRYLCTHPSDPVETGARHLFERIIRVLGMPLRESGLRIELRPGTADRAVRAVPATRAVFAVARAACAVMPSASEATLRAELHAGGRAANAPFVSVRSIAAPEYLPFPLDFEAIADRARVYGVTIVDASSNTLSVRLG